MKLTNRIAALAFISAAIIALSLPAMQHWYQAQVNLAIAPFVLSEMPTAPILCEVSAKAPSVECGVLDRNALMLLLKQKAAAKGANSIYVYQESSTHHGHNLTELEVKAYGYK